MVLSQQPNFYTKKGQSIVSPSRYHLSNKWYQTRQASSHTPLHSVATWWIQWCDPSSVADVSWQFHTDSCNC